MRRGLVPDELGEPRVSGIKTIVHGYKNELSEPGLILRRNCYSYHGDPPELFTEK